MGLARRLGDNWWLPGAAVFVGIAALFTFVSPYIDYTTEPLRDEDLIEAADRFESALGLPDDPRLRPGGESRRRTGQRVRVQVQSHEADRLLGHRPDGSLRRR